MSTEGSPAPDPAPAADHAKPLTREVYAKGLFRSDRSDHFVSKAVYTPFSPEDKRNFYGQIIPADPICASAPLKNAGRVQGHVVLILRGDVSFDIKMQHAVAAGATGVIFANTYNKLFRAEAEAVWDIPSVMVDNETYQRVHGRNIIAPAKYFADFEPDRLQLLQMGDQIERALEEGRMLKMEVTVLGGYDLKNMEFMFEMDPYCEVSVGRESRRTKTHRGGGRNPIWNQKLRFHVNVKTERRMVLRCMDEETLKAADLVGENLSIPLDGLFNNNSGMTEMSVPLTDEDGLPSGRVDIALKLLVPLSLEEKKKAKLGFKTCLDIEIEGARYLPKNINHILRQPNPYCKVTVAGVCKRTKTKKEGGTDPQWLQTLRMPLPHIEDGVDSKYMIVEVWDQGEGMLQLDTCLGKHEIFDLTQIIDSGVGFDGVLPLDQGTGKIKLKIDKVTEVYGQRVELVSKDKGMSLSTMASFAIPVGIIAAVPWFRAVTGNFFFSLVNVVFALLPVMSVGIFLQRRNIVSSIIKSILGRVLGVGTFEDGGDGHLNFRSTVEMADIHLTTFLHFLWTGKVTLRDVEIPNPCGFKPSVGTHSAMSRTLLRAESIYIHARLLSFLKPIKHVSLVLIKNFELVVSVNDAGQANAAIVGANAGGFVSTIDRILGRDVVIIHHVCLKSGSANLTASFLGAETQTAVEIDKIDVLNVGKNGDEDAGNTVLKKIFDELQQSATKSFHTKAKLAMHINLDPEAEFGLSDSDEEEDLEDLAELRSDGTDKDEYSVVEEEEEEEEEAAGCEGSDDGEEKELRHVAY